MPGDEGKKKILVVSNDKDIIKKIKSLKLDYPVAFSVLRESYGILKKLRTRHAGLFILDYNLPLISGDELIKLVHDSCPDIPIITIIDDINTEARKQAIDAGTYDFVENPIDIEELKSKILNLLFSEAYH